MRKTILTLAIAGLAAGAAVPAQAADVDSAVKTLEAVAADPAKQEAYCGLTATLDEVGEDQKKAKAAEEEIQGYFKTLGPEFDEAWSAGSELKEGSAELKKFDAALEKLDEPCYADDKGGDDKGGDDAAK